MKIINEFGETVGTLENDVFVLYNEEMGFVTDEDMLRKYLWTLGLDLV